MRVRCSLLAIAAIALLTAGCGSSHARTKTFSTKLGLVPNRSNPLSLNVPISAIRQFMSRSNSVGAGGCYVLSYNHRTHKWTAKGPRKHNHC